MKRKRKKLTVRTYRRGAAVAEWFVRTERREQRLLVRRGQRRLGGGKVRLTCEERRRAAVAGRRKWEVCLPLGDRVGEPNVT